MDRQTKTWLCVNDASGSNDDGRVREVAGALEAVGARPQRIVDVLSGALPQPPDLVQAGAELLVVFTGDGTANAVVGGLEGWAGKVLVLPGGTANLLSRALHGEREAAAIVADLPKLRAVRRPCIRTAQGVALIEVLAGPGATWSDVREEMRGGDLPGMATASLTAIRQSTTGPMVAVVAPPLGKPEGYSGVRLEPRPSGILIEGYGVDTIADYFRQGVALLRRDFRQGPHEDLGLEPEIVCRSLVDSPIELMIDGERRTGAAEERFSLAELGVDLLASV
jgi:hypothetical protein